LNRKKAQENTCRKKIFVILNLKKPRSLHTFLAIKSRKKSLKSLFLLTMRLTNDDCRSPAFLVERGDERGVRTAGAAQVLACNLQIRR